MTAGLTNRSLTSLELLAHTLARHNSARQLPGQENLLKQRGMWDFKTVAAVWGLIPLLLHQFSIRALFESILICQNKNFGGCLVLLTRVAALSWHGH